MQTITAAICQNRPGRDKEANVARACDMIAAAASHGARLVTLAEIFYYPYELHGIRQVADTDMKTLETLRDAAVRYGIYLCTGTMAIRREAGFGNTAFLIAPSGDILLEYSKTHLFDVNLENLSFRESSFIVPGNSVEVARTPLGVIGILVCYDIRFPEIARMLALRGAEIIIVPAAFNTTTGPAHWHVMFRARAIENQLYVMAASQARTPASAYEAYGHSMVVDPWGNVVAEADDDETVVYAELKAETLEETRRRLPLLMQRRPELYDIS